MSIHDTDDLNYVAPEPPGLAERWLRRIFVEDFKLKLLALGITLVLWFAVTGQKRPSTKRLPGVQLSYMHSDGLAISNDPPPRVDITVSGSKDEIDQLNPSNLLATVVIGDNGTGNRVVRLTKDVVKIEQLPSTVRIDAFQPAIVSVRLEPRVDRQVDVSPKFEGKIPDGYELGSISVSPVKVRLRGPASIVSGIKEVNTESIVLDGKTASFDLNQVAVDVPNEKIEVLDSIVQVHVEVIPRPVQKTFKNVPMEGSPHVASLKVTAPHAIIRYRSRLVSLNSSHPHTY
jgi:YbbR domain-containing protein